MGSKQDKDRFSWPDNDAIFSTRLGVKLRSDGSRVRLGLYAFLKAWLVTFGVWFVITLLFTLFALFSSPASLALSVWGVVLAVSLFIAAFFGTPVALLLDWLLRRVHQQWIHVLVFGCSFAFLTFLIASLLLTTSVRGLSSVLAVIVGGAAAIGRASVRHNVELYTIPNPTYVPTHRN